MKMLLPRWSAALLVVWVLVGCSHQEFSRPLLRKPTDVVGDLFDSGEPYVESAEPRSRLRMERLAQALAAWQGEPEGDTSDYLIGPGDVLEVAIFALESPEKTSVLTRAVSREGCITLLWAGSVQAAGLSARGLEERIKAAYAGAYLRDPQVTVTVTEYGSCAVVVTGAVRNPGIYCLSTNKSTVLAMLARAGGLSEEAGDELLIIRSGERMGRRAGSSRPAEQPGSPAQVEAPGGLVELAPSVGPPQQVLPGKGRQAGADRTPIAVDLTQLVDEGNLLLNLEVSGGDVLTVPPVSEEYVYVLGYVTRPGSYELQDGVRVDALRAVALAGGLLRTARAENSFLVRETAEGRQIVPVDLTKIARGVRPPLYLQSGDTLVIGSSLLARMSEFIRPSAGFHYSPGR